MSMTDLAALGFGAALIIYAAVLVTRADREHRAATLAVALMLATLGVSVAGILVLDARAQLAVVLAGLLIAAGLGATHVAATQREQRRRAQLAAIAGEPTPPQLLPARVAATLVFALMFALTQAWTVGTQLPEIRQTTDAILTGPDAAPFAIAYWLMSTIVVVAPFPTAIAAYLVQTSRINLAQTRYERASDRFNARLERERERGRNEARASEPTL